MRSDYKLKAAEDAYLKLYVIMKKTMYKNKILEMMNKYSWIDRKFADIQENNSDKTPQFGQHASNCRFYSMCNNTYYNLQNFNLSDLIEVKNIMKSEWFNMKEWWDWCISWAFIAKYLSEKLDLPVRCFQIDFYKDTLKFAELLKKWVVFEMSRFNAPMLYLDAHDDWKVNQIYRPYQATGWHSTNIYYDPEKKLLKELWTWWDDSKNNQFYYDILYFWKNIQTRCISPIFNFIWILKDE